jgi:hypothetical protein
LTAAHCFQSTYNPYLAIDLGVHNRDLKESWSVTRKGAKVIIHPEWSSSEMKGDIALIKLDVFFYKDSSNIFINQKENIYDIIF